MTEPRCAVTDAVLAHFLDGEAEPPVLSREGWGITWTAAELAEHRAECEVCARELRRARRLDAAIASGAAGVASRDGAADDVLIATAMAAALAGGTADRPRVGRRLAAAVVVLVVLVGAGMYALGRAGRGPAPVAPEVPAVAVSVPPPAAPFEEPAATPAAPPVRDTDIVLPPLAAGTKARAARRRSPAPPWSAPPRTAAEVARATAALQGDELAGAVRALVALRGLDGWAAPAGVELRIAGEVRLACALRLAEAGGGAALAALSRCVMEWEAGPPRAGLIAALRRDADFCRRLAAAIATEGDSARPPLVAAAAVLGGERLDEALRARAVGDVSFGERLADAVLAAGERPGAARLLLSVWLDQVVRFGSGDDRGRWFARLGEDATDELLAVLASSRHGSERRLCLLALEARGDGRATPALRAMLAGAQRDEAELAAFALGGVPAGGDDLALEPSEPRVRALTLAALGRRADPRLEGVIASLEITAEERAFLTAGGYAPHQFSIAVRLFQERVWGSVLEDPR